MIDPAYSAAQDSKVARFRAGRRLKLDATHWAEVGNPVYGAENWPRLDAWVRSRHLVAA